MLALLDQTVGIYFSRAVAFVPSIGGRDEQGKFHAISSDSPERAREGGQRISSSVS